jgi:hypothetical protein
MPVWNETYVHCIDGNANELMLHLSPLPNACVEIVGKNSLGSVIRIVLPINEAKSFFQLSLSVINDPQPEFE